MNEENEPEPPVHPLGESEMDDSPSDVPSDSVKPRSALPGALLVCVNALLAVVWFVALARPAERASGQATSAPVAPVVATATATVPMDFPPEATPTTQARATATPVGSSKPPVVAPTSTIPVPTATTPVVTPTPTPTMQPPTPMPTPLPGA